MSLQETSEYFREIKQNNLSGVSNMLGTLIEAEKSGFGRHRTAVATLLWGATDRFHFGAQVVVRGFAMNCNV